MKARLNASRDPSSSLYSPRIAHRPAIMDSSASHAGPSRTKQHTPHHPAGGPADGIPGVSKLKSQIRQTTRLLAKVRLSRAATSDKYIMMPAAWCCLMLGHQDTLDPQLRIQTERRLASLNADLAKAQTRGVEQKNGEKYHMVRYRCCCCCLFRVLICTDSSLRQVKFFGGSPSVLRSELEGMLTEPIFLSGRAEKTAPDHSPHAEAARSAAGRGPCRHSCTCTCCRDRRQKGQETGQEGQEGWQGCTRTRRDGTSAA